MPPQPYRLIEPGQRFGRGVVIQEIRLPLTKGEKAKGAKTGSRGALLLCDCDGKTYQASVYNLFNGNTQSCGCIRDELNESRALPLFCSIPDCPDKPVGRTWCSKHYQQWRINGDPLHVALIIPGAPRKVKSEYDPETNTKICSGPCGLRKHVSEFSPLKAGAGGVTSKCKKCAAEAAIAKFHELSDDRKLDLDVRKYGLTAQDYNAMLEAQNYVCAICKRPEKRKYNSSEKISRLVVDHDHETGKVRALLCHRCNVGIGSFNDDPILMKEALHYLQKEL